MKHFNPELIDNDPVIDPDGDANVEWSNFVMTIGGIMLVFGGAVGIAALIFLASEVFQWP